MTEGVSLPSLIWESARDRISQSYQDASSNLPDIEIPEIEPHSSDFVSQIKSESLILYSHISELCSQLPSLYVQLELEPKDMIYILTAIIFLILAAIRVQRYRSTERFTIDDVRVERDSSGQLYFGEYAHLRKRCRHFSSTEGNLKNLKLRRHTVRDLHARFIPHLKYISNSEKLPNDEQRDQSIQKTKLKYYLQKDQKLSIAWLRYVFKELDGLLFDNLFNDVRIQFHLGNISHDEWHTSVSPELKRRVRCRTQCKNVAWYEVFDAHICIPEVKVWEGSYPQEEIMSKHMIRLLHEMLRLFEGLYSCNGKDCQNFCIVEVGKGFKGHGTLVTSMAVQAAKVFKQIIPECKPGVWVEQSALLFWELNDGDLKEALKLANDPRVQVECICEDKTHSKRVVARRYTTT